MQSFKIVITGSVGAGKTTAISQLSDIDVVSTDVASSEKQIEKALTTVGIDYGHIDISDDLRLLLYGTPGQKRFSFMWRIAAEDALGAIILVNASDPELYENLEHFVQFYRGEGLRSIVIGVTHSDEEQSESLDAIFQYMVTTFDQALPIFPCDARKKDDVLFLLEVLIARIEAEL